jgi:hypothetical protein
MACWINTLEGCGEKGAVVRGHDRDGGGVALVLLSMTLSVAVILGCILAGLIAVVGIGVQAMRHGPRLVWRWLLLPLGAFLSFAFIPASVAFAEGVWGADNPRLWVAVSLGSVGVLFQILGWRAVLRPRLRPAQCPGCEYHMDGLSRCPECGRPTKPPDQ